MPAAPIWPQKRAEGLSGGRPSTVMLNTAGRQIRKNNAGGTHVRPGHADNHHEPYRRPMNITTLMCHTLAPSPLAEPFFLCRGVYGLRNPADFSMLYARRSSAGAGGFAVNCERDCSARPRLRVFLRAKFRRSRVARQESVFFYRLRLPSRRSFLSLRLAGGSG